MKLIFVLVVLTSVVSLSLAEDLEKSDDREVTNSMLKYLKNFKNGKPVTITLMYEPLCPFCRIFITEQLLPAFERYKNTKVIKVVEMVPYGNAYWTKKPGQPRVFHCQHGPRECKISILHNCIMKQTDYQFKKFVPVIGCVEDEFNPLKTARKCIKKANLNYNAIEKCYHGKEGKALMFLSSKITDKYFQLHNLKHRFVPFILINNKYSSALAARSMADLKQVLFRSYVGVNPVSTVEPSGDE